MNLFQNVRLYLFRFYENWKKKQLPYTHTASRNKVLCKHNMDAVLICRLCDYGFCFIKWLKSLVNDIFPFAFSAQR